MELILRKGNLEDIEISSISPGIGWPNGLKRGKYHKLPASRLIEMSSESI
jgi:hypothetical protein